MEAIKLGRLDDVEMGKEEWKQIIRDFYPDFKESVDNAAEKLEKIEIKDEESDVRRIQVPRRIQSVRLSCCCYGIHQP